MGHFQFLMCLCFKTSLSANPFIWKRLYMQFHFHANQSHFHKNGLALRLALKQRHKGTRKWPILGFHQSCDQNKNRNHSMKNVKSLRHDR